MQNENNFDLLKYLHEEQRSQLSYCSGREYQIFSWSNAILLAIAGSTFIGSGKESNLIVIQEILITVSLYFSLFFLLYGRCTSADALRVIKKYWRAI